jgi:hypothetical protein
MSVNYGVRYHSRRGRRQAAAHRAARGEMQPTPLELEVGETLYAGFRRLRPGEHEWHWLNTPWAPDTLLLLERGGDGSMERLAVTTQQGDVIPFSIAAGADEGLLKRRLSVYTARLLLELIASRREASRYASEAA